MDGTNFVWKWLQTEQFWKVARFSVGKLPTLGVRQMQKRSWKLQAPLVLFTLVDQFIFGSKNSDGARFLKHHNKMKKKKRKKPSGIPESAAHFPESGQLPVTQVLRGVSGQRPRISDSGKGRLNSWEFFSFLPSLPLCGVLTAVGHFLACLPPRHFWSLFGQKMKSFMERPLLH